jgi:vesicle-associated membrane protein 7
MSILYSIIARGKTVLAEFTLTTGNFPTITRVLLGKIPCVDGKMSYVYDKYVFIENNIIYMCMTDQMEKRRIPFEFLEDIKQRFVITYGDRAQTAQAFAMSEDFGRTMQKQMAYYNSPSADEISRINNKLDLTKTVMVENIEKILERGEKLELLVDKTDQLQQQAFKFEKSSKQLKSAMYWRRIKLYLLVFFLVALVIWIISVIICGIDYGRCKSKN